MKRSSFGRVTSRQLRANLFCDLFIGLKVKLGSYMINLRLLFVTFYNNNYSKRVSYYDYT